MRSPVPPTESAEAIAASTGGATAVEKILARASGRERVGPGDIVHPDPDLVIVHDGYFETLARQLLDLGIGTVFDPDRFLVVTDHEVAYTGERAAARGRANRELAACLGVRHFFDAGDGGHGHVMPVEAGWVTPGSLVLAYDMHSTNFGAIGALALYAAGEIVSVAATGTLWTQVPQSVRVTMIGSLGSGVGARDVAAALAHELAAGELCGPVDNVALEIAGPALAGFGIDGRMTLCNTATEVGVATVFVEPDANVLRQGGVAHDRLVRSDQDARYRSAVRFDVSSVEPMIAVPPTPDNVVPVSALAGTRVQHAVIGSCASGMYEDMRAVAEVLAGRRVDPRVRLVITPATHKIYLRCLVEGIVTTFARAGALVTPPGCGPCAGGKLGAVAAGEVSISTIATNHEGRMGAQDATIYLGSPATVAASAVAGCIVDPRELVREGVG